MLTVICHTDTPGGEREGEREREEREREKEREKREEGEKGREREKRGERIGSAIDIYTTYTVHLLPYLHAIELSV